MTIQAQKVITLNYTLRDKAGVVIDQSQDGSFCYLHGANNIIPGLEKALHGRKQGEQFKVTLEPSDAYGEYNPALTQVVERDMFENSDEIAVGMQFHAQSDDGRFIAITVTEVNGDKVTVDGNPPLAGATLYYDVNVVDIRDASAEEIQHGHVHGAHGHHHDHDHGGGGCGSGKSSGGGCGSGGCGSGGCH
ncbi:MAG: peptidylprolyl isomerase [Gammaproteobacteria bacterium]|nr:peptidylprolyl isomerase [Gammaproteobacteria bacterium]